ncbi:MBL fold metallo-hydrolase [Mucilaginibacter sp.]|uniref:MBL fold metallo-hydrolase n=1 Tax=Mucilaginibacter sp. TaxID=1882438 RepID=UPI0025EFCA4B|nr:MBL fold metallo-hydrolase [Mucilaginibacter sp.]
MTTKNTYHPLVIITLLIFIVPAFSFNIFSHKAPPAESWCDRPLRRGLEKLAEIKTSRPWFKVYNVGHNTYAIDEPYNWEETIGYLILGKDKALLFDTGMGLDSISFVVKELTKLPVTVLNSHTHPDHIGGNSEFGHVLAMNTNYTRNNSARGYQHQEVKWEVRPASFCLSRLPRADTAHYSIKPFKVSKFISDGYMIDLGSRKLQVIATPGHTPDAICLYDKQAGDFWCGDSFYEGPILLSGDSTDLKAYKKSINIMSHFAAMSKRVLPAHNLPIADPALVIKAAAVFNQIASGAQKGVPGEDNTLVFDFGKFSYQIGQRFMPQLVLSKKP